MSDARDDTEVNAAADQPGAVKSSGGGDYDNMDADAMRALLASQKAELASQNAELASMHAKLAYSEEKFSVKHVLEMFDGFPPMEVNRDTKPSAYDDTKSNHEGDSADGESKQTKKRNTPENGGAAADKPAQKKRTSMHENADAGTLEPNIAEALKEVVMNYMDEEDMLIKSTLAMQLGTNWRTIKDKKLSNFNKASPAAAVMAGILDILGCMGLRDDVEIGMEVSIFSLRPDVVVLRYRTQIILVVEVKSPGPDGSTVVRLKTALGQQYDYAMGMRRMGIDNPFVVLTTYTHLQVGTLNDDITSIVEEALERLKQGRGKLSKSEDGKDKPRPSPEKKGPSRGIPDDSALPRQEVSSNDQGTSESHRHVFISDVFEKRDLVSALVLSIACGIVSADRNPGTYHPTIPSEGDKLTGSFARVRVDGFSWVSHPAKTATYALKSSFRKDQNVFLHDVLGIGNSGKVYLTSDTSGHFFASKLYPYSSQTMASFDPTENERQKQQEQSERVGMLNREKNIWNDLYPEYAKSVYATALLDTPCLMMPYVAPVPMDRRREKGLFRKVQDEMNRVAGKGYLYAKKDLRWRHVGLRKGENGKERVVLVDLASLIHLVSSEKLEKDSWEEQDKESLEDLASLLDIASVEQLRQKSLTEHDLQTALEKQMRELWKRADTDIQPFPSGLMGGRRRTDN